MPVSVSVRMLSGDWKECKMPATASVGNLKYALSQQCGSRPKLWHIYNASFIKCADEDSLLDMAELHAVVCTDDCTQSFAVMIALSVEQLLHARSAAHVGKCDTTNIARAAFRIEARLPANWPGFQPTGFQPTSHAYESYQRLPSKIAGLPANEVTYVRYVRT